MTIPLSPRVPALAAIALTLVTGCSGGGGGGGATAEARTLADAVIDPAFDYETTRPVRMAVHVRSAEGHPLAWVGVTVSTESDARLASGRTDASGAWEQSIAVSSAERRLIVRAATIGIPAEAVADVAETMTIDLGS